MTFSDGEINLNAASLFSNVFFFTEFFLFIQQQTTYSKENMIIMGPKKNKIKENKKKSKKPKNVKKIIHASD